MRKMSERGMSKAGHSHSLTSLGDFDFYCFLSLLCMAEMQFLGIFDTGSEDGVDKSRLAYTGFAYHCTHHVSLA